MGTSKLYDVYSEQLARLEVDEDRLPRPISIPEEIVRASGRRHDEQPPIPVRVHVPFQIAYTDVQLVDAEAIAWTTGGFALIRYVPPGRRHPVYVWVAANLVHRTK